MGGDESGSDRFNKGKKYVLQNTKAITGDFEKDEPIDIVTHSEGSAMGAGIAYQLIRMGINVRNVYHLSADEGYEFSTPSQPFTIQYSYEGDWITQNHRINGTDAAFIDCSFEGRPFDQFKYSHGSTNQKNIFQLIEKIINNTPSDKLRDGNTFKIHFRYDEKK